MYKFHIYGIGQDTRAGSKQKTRKKDVRRLYFAAFFLRLELHVHQMSVESAQNPVKHHRKFMMKNAPEENKMKFFLRSIGSALEGSKLSRTKKLFVVAADDDASDVPVNQF
jgi:hypothetical protein